MIKTDKGKKRKELLTDAGFLLVSGFLFGMAYNMFLIPGGIFIGGAGGLAHQVLIQMDQDRLVRRLCGVNGIQLLRRTAHADGEARLLLPAAAEKAQAQRRCQRQRPRPLPVSHIIAPHVWS